MQIMIEVAQQFATRPTLHEVAARMVHDMLARKYPQLKIDPQRASVTGLASTGSAHTAAGHQAMSLTESLLQCFARQAAPGWITGEVALWADPTAPGARPLDVNVELLGTDLELLSFGLLEEFAQATANFWSAPLANGSSRWKWLAERVQRDLVDDLASTRSQGLDQTSRDALHTISMFAHRSDRDFMLGLTAPGPDRLELAVGILYFKISGALAAASMPFPAVVLQHTQGGHTQLTAWRANGDVHRADNVDELASAICSEMSAQWDFDEFDWALHESSGNIFLDLTQAILGRQITDILAVQGAMSYDLPALEHYLMAATDVCVWLQPSTAKPALSVSYIPAWLRNAPSADKITYSRGLLALAAAQVQAQGKAFNDDLPPIMAFTRQALNREMRRDYPAGEPPIPDEIEVIIHKVAGTAVGSGGQPVISGSVEPVSMTLVQFALHNLCGLPPGEITVHMAGGWTVPSWLTPGYLKTLVTRVDIGGTYPRLLQRYLIDDLDEASRRRRLFADQLRVQLPLKALEQKFRQQGAISARGCRMVAALMAVEPAQRNVDGQSVVLRPLAIVRAPGHAADKAANLFVIGPQDTGKGPHLLYRPFRREPLTEFRSWSALWQAIVAPGELQDDVLVWLSDTARPIYANGGFHEPHIVRFGLGSEFAPLERPAPASLGSEVCAGDPLAELFDATARALVTLADRSSVSNAESRWAIFKEGGWVVLNAVLPLLGGAVANTIWLVQLLMNFERFMNLPEDSDAQTRLNTIAELLVTVAMMLLQDKGSVHALAHRQFAPARSESGAPRRAAQVREVALEEVAPVLDFSWTSPLNQLDAGQRSALQGFRLPRDFDLRALSGHEVESGLYRVQEQVIVRIGVDLYRVESDEDGYFIVAPDNVAVQGPRISRDAAGWNLDLRLHLRGGGPKRRAKELADLNTQNLRRVRERRTELGRRRDELYRKLQAYHSHLSSESEEVRALFLARHSSDLQEALSAVRQRSALVQELRPGDRPSEREQGADLKTVSSQVRYLEGMILSDIGDVARKAGVAVRGEAAQAPVGGERVDAWLVLFNKLVDKQQAGVQWATVRESLWRQMRELPTAGDAFWRDDITDFERAQLPTLLEWQFMEAFSCLELSLSREDLLDPQAHLQLKALRTNKKLYEAVSSHAQLEKPNSYSLTERIGVVESALREYQRGLEVARFVRENNFIAQPNVFLERFINHLEAICDATQSRLTGLIQENIDPPPVPVERLPRREQPRKKIIRTRDRRVLVADISDDENTGPTADVRDVLSGQVSTRWHQHADGGWTQVEPATPARPAVTPRPGAAKMRQRASLLLAQVAQVIANARRQATRAVEPEDIEDILTLRAGQLTELADGLGEVEGGGLVPELREAAARMIQEGRSLRIAMTKAQPPTASRVSYLHHQGEIDIARVGPRINLSGVRRDDFMQEYSIRDKQHQLLWWAHFHYASEDAAPAAFTAAHLKLPAQRKMGYKALIRAAKDNKAVVDIYRSTIGRELAQRLFLALDPHG
ncbi:dermonecrotic toxin domain-containing protein [Pseudomonas sp. v388]|uniref:dermonecrotic toxin domain-containing protein n=1 Tax=Pseudomonas sp. v388 TaxID=2479849 RepID=UPI000F78B116|nr:DUF6543 domain-containing protein [Pseudomonas sp. v388]